ncbi:hypothetical protein SAMN05216388_10211, partial [Halorientalis persicus]
TVRFPVLKVAKLNLLLGDFDNEGAAPLFDSGREQTTKLVGNFHQ